jgi:hypothetical protein
MKVITDKPAFTPINLVIESEAELNLLVSLLGHMVPNLATKIAGKYIDITPVYHKLKSHCTNVSSIKLNITEDK